MSLLEVGDKVTIQYNPCRICDCEVGYEEYEMSDYEGQTLELQVENLYERYEGARLASLACGGERFEYDDWMWTTCWITNHVSVFTTREPDWEV